MTKSGGQSALAFPTPNSGGPVALSPVIYAHGCYFWPTSQNNTLSSRQTKSYGRLARNCSICQQQQR